MRSADDQLASDLEFAAIWHDHGGDTARIARALGVNVRAVFRRRNRVEERLKITLPASQDTSGRQRIDLSRVGIRQVDSVTGTVIVFSDAHFRPEEDPSPAFLALKKLIRKLRPTMVVDNGDSLDFPGISNHPAQSWAPLPTVSDEVNFAKERLAEIEEITPPGCKLVKCLGNHDWRFVKRLANHVPEYSGVKGFALEDHFPSWSTGVSLALNMDVPRGATIIKHKPAGGGIHASWNSLLRGGGVHFVHSHLHRGQITIMGGYLGNRWAVDTGTLSEILIGRDSGKFSYDEDAARNWSQAFAVLTYTDDGRLQPPELCTVLDGVAYFRGRPV